jgi:hypothetical protein
MPLPPSSNEEKTMQLKESRCRPEFWLVVIMLLVLTLLVYLVLWAAPVPVPVLGKDDSIKPSEILDYRKNILAVIITAFGAWIGAGAAYFFGRENLRETAKSLLEMRGLSPRERLRRTPIRGLSLKPFDWVVKPQDKLKDVVEKIKENSDHWFIPIVNADGVLQNIIHEDAVWRFIDSESTKEQPPPYPDIMAKTVSDVQAYITNQAKSDPRKVKRINEIYVRVTLEKSAADANELMQNKGVFIAVITDEKGKPTHFVTTAEIRTALLQAD